MPSTTRHSRAARVVAGLFALALAFVAYTAYVVYAPFGPVTETFVDIPSGTGSAQIAAQLEQAHIIRSRLAFELLRLAKGGTLHAGEYRFDHPTPPASVTATPLP